VIMHGHSVVQSANSYEAWKFGALLSVEHGGSNGYQWPMRKFLQAETFSS